MAEGTVMVLKVDLGCEKCRRKIKKLLCKYPEIRDQDYNEKEDTVIIKVVCCNPERIRQKLICKGGKLIKSIEIRQPKKEKQKPATPPPSKPATPTPSKLQAPPPVTGYPTMFYPRWVCCTQCFEGQWGGPCNCHHGSYWIPYKQPPSSYGCPSGCCCDTSHGCRCEYYTESYPLCTLM